VKGLHEFEDKIQAINSAKAFFTGVEILFTGKNFT
jgi:hypothetical protein